MCLSCTNIEYHEKKDKDIFTYYKINVGQSDPTGNMELFISVSCIIIPLLIFWKFDFLKWLLFRKQKLKQFADFYALNASENGVLPSRADKVMDSWNPGNVFYFFGFDGEDQFQMTLKIRRTGGFFILKIKHTKI